MKFVLFLCTVLCAVKEMYNIRYPLSNEVLCSNTEDLESLEKEIIQDLEDAEVEMDIFYEMQRKEEEKHGENCYEIMNTIKEDATAILADFIETIQTKMNANFTMLEEEIKRHMDAMPKDDRNEFKEFKEKVHKYIEHRRKSAERTDKLTIKKHELMKKVFSGLKARQSEQSFTKEQNMQTKPF
eukprot:GHVN01011157.1.p1 GENE.GHVN01011157.1~~GHVN01011157.1.p1  ORF type:complete len:184 (+),score=30.26 GHVN01011157.1:4-555(+)